MEKEENQEPLETEVENISPDEDSSSIEISTALELPMPSHRNSTESGKFMQRGSRLRRSLLKKIVPITYRDPFKSKGLTAASFLGPIVDQKIDRFATLMERLITKSNKKN